MKKYLTLVLLLTLACSEAPFEPVETGLQGHWLGWSIITHPGMVDEPITDSVQVAFLFEEEEVSFSEWNSRPIMPPIVLYSGTYTVRPDSILLSMNHVPPEYSPFHLDGGFSFELDGNSLTMLQWPEHIWPTIHEVKLTRQEVWPTD